MPTYQTGMASQGRGFKPFPEGTLGVRKQTFTVDTALALNDVIQMIPVYAGETVVDVQLISADLDTNGAPAIVLDVGDGESTARYIDGSTVGQAGGFARSAPVSISSYPHTYTADDTIDILVQVAPATGATSVDITLIAYIV